MTITPYIPALFVALVGWRAYSRYRRLVGKQPLRPQRLWASVVLFPLLFMLLGVLNSTDGAALAGLFAGGIGGIGLAFVGLRLTKFEASAAELSYTPNAYIGTALFLLLLGRISYRFVQLYAAIDAHGHAPMQSIAHGPTTLLTLGIILGYYASYSAGVLRRRRVQRNAGRG